MILQDPVSSLNPRRQVRDIVAEPLTIWGTQMGIHDGAARRSKVDEVLRAVGLDVALECSGGLHDEGCHPYKYCR